MTYPGSSRHGGSLQLGGDCGKSSGACYWFTNNQKIPEEPTLDDASVRCVNVNISSGPEDWSRQNPWRAPGHAPVLGSGCGVAGGGPVAYANGGTPPSGVAQGTDGLMLAARTPTVWAPGSVQEVGMAVSANHAGGYSWRLCKNNGSVSEECFQQGTLEFAGDKQFIVYTDGSWSEIPLTKVSTGTFPPGSEWARFPVPSCLLCNPVDECGAVLQPTSGLDYQSAWNLQVNCNAACAGSSASKAGGSCPERTQFPEPIEGLSGFGKSIWDWSVVDRMTVPADLEPGAYLLSLRWDAEQSDQVFQNCADITISADGTSDAGIDFDPAKKLTTYRPRGNSKCEDNLYENCDKGNKGAKQEDKDGKYNALGWECFEFGQKGNRQACEADNRCDWMDEKQKEYCWSAAPEPESEPGGSDAALASAYISTVAAIAIATAIPAAISLEA